MEQTSPHERSHFRSWLRLLRKSDDKLGYVFEIVGRVGSLHPLVDLGGVLERLQLHADLVTNSQGRTLSKLIVLHNVKSDDCDATLILTSNDLDDLYSSKGQAVPVSGYPRRRKR